MYKQTLVMLMSLWCASALAENTGYKCERTEGNKTIIAYSQLPKAGYVCVSLNKTPDPTVDPNAEMQKLRDKVNEISKPGDESQQQEVKTRAERRAENCELAKNNVTILESDQEVARTKQDGKKVLLNDDERAAALSQARENVELYCSS